MSTIIRPNIPRQCDVYPIKEWLWRGIKDPELFGGIPSILKIPPGPWVDETDTGWTDENTENWESQ